VGRRRVRSAKDRADQESLPRLRLLFPAYTETPNMAAGRAHTMDSGGHGKSPFPQCLILNLRN
jgi:hypothetical protein